jgi:hypothetical protein
MVDLVVVVVSCDSRCHYFQSPKATFHFTIEFDLIVFSCQKSTSKYTLLPQTTICNFSTMKLSPIVYYAVALWMSFVPSATATEDSNGRRQLRGEETYNGPVAEGEQVLDRELEGEIVTPELIAERNKELELAFEAENGNERKLLVDPRCKVWCLGFQRGYCRNFYPRCDPLRRDLEGESVTAELIAERNKELDLAFEAENGHERKLLVDPRCKVWCLGFQRGYCRNFYPRCDPL